MKRNVKLILLVLVVAAAAVGSYSIRRYHQAAPPFHYKQPAFSATHTVGSITVDNASPITAQPSLQGSAVSTAPPSTDTADSATAGATSSAINRAHASPQGSSNGVQGVRSTVQNLQNAVTGILGL